MNPVAAASPKLASPLALLELSEIAAAPLRYGHAVRVLAAGRPNILLGTGAVPYETPPVNLLLIRDYVA